MNELLSAKSIVGGLVLVVTTMGIAYLSNTGRLPKWFVDAWIILESLTYQNLNRQSKFRLCS